MLSSKPESIDKNSDFCLAKHDSFWSRSSRMLSTSLMHAFLLKHYDLQCISINSFIHGRVVCLGMRVFELCLSGAYMHTLLRHAQGALGRSALYCSVVAKMRVFGKC